jgi:hypothetical protein
MELEFQQLELRYERLRLMRPGRERRLLAAIAGVGQQVPILVVADGAASRAGWTWQSRRHWSSGWRPGHGESTGRAEGHALQGRDPRGGSPRFQPRDRARMGRADGL